MEETTTAFAGALLVVYDLRDPEAWERARRERRAWGWEQTAIHTLDNDRIVIEFLPGGTAEVSA